MQAQTQPQVVTLSVVRSCHCAFAVYANIPVTDERGRYCSACGHYEFPDSVTTRQ